MNHRDREERQMNEGLSVAGMASLYYKSVTGIKPNIVTLASFITERDFAAKRFGGKLAANYLLGRFRDIETEDQEQADNLQKVMGECHVGKVTSGNNHCSSMQFLQMRRWDFRRQPEDSLSGNESTDSLRKSQH